VNKYPTLDANNFLVNGSNTPLYAFRFETQTISTHSEILWIVMFSGIMGLLILQIVDKKRKIH
jgi:hypothetical protein